MKRLPQSFLLLVAACAILLGGAFPARDASATDTAGQKIERIAQKTGNGIRKGAEWAGNGIKKGAIKAGEGISKGMTHAGNGIQTGVRKTGEAFEKVGSKLQ